MNFTIYIRTPNALLRTIESLTRCLLISGIFDRLAYITDPTKLLKEKKEENGVKIQNKDSSVKENDVHENDENLNHFPPSNVLNTLLLSRP